VNGLKPRVAQLRRAASLACGRAEAVEERVAYREPAGRGGVSQRGDAAGGHGQAGEAGGDDDALEVHGAGVISSE